MFQKNAKHDSKYMKQETRNKISETCFKNAKHVSKSKNKKQEQFLGHVSVSDFLFLVSCVLCLVKQEI